MKLMTSLFLLIFTYENCFAIDQKALERGKAKSAASVTKGECFIKFINLCGDKTNSNLCLELPETKRDLGDNCIKMINCQNELDTQCPSMKDGEKSERTPEKEYYECLRSKRNLISSSCREILLPSEKEINVRIHCSIDLKKLCPDKDLSDRKSFMEIADCRKKAQKKMTPECTEARKELAIEEKYSSP